jgi:hypothetical protein
LYDSSLDCGVSENLTPAFSEHFSATENPSYCINIADGVSITSMEINADNPNDSPDFGIYLYKDGGCATLIETSQGGGDECLPAERIVGGLYLFILSN